MSAPAVNATHPARDDRAGRGRLGRVGLWTGSLEGVPVAQVPDVLGELDDQGWGSLWFGEAVGREAFTAAQLYLGATRRMTIGTGIANIYGRDASAAGSAARTLEASHPGRFVLGLGVSHAPLVERHRGHHYGRPLSAMREYLDALDRTRALAAGEDVMPPVVLAALGPKMLGLSRDRTAGAHPYLTLPEHTARAREILGGTGEDGPALVVEHAAVVAAGVGDDDEVWRSRAHDHLTVYTGLPNYRNSWTRQGFEESDYVRGGSDRLKRALVTRGLEATRARVQEHLDAGASTVLVQVLGENMLVPPVQDWRLAAEALLG
ncbi:TIGR03620 family F420-dependent LLM class oxidoreductase [uncultured Dietzia sp.]|uniref:TIGR03620 family F420-dependent LLM class oxidoreductase n=2 Tax=Dietzia TaxID=37914 RepID=UPI0026231B3A|nr:TIGR03620 family F420-dependent LLM class oxidoreductase [uncultured Dietzia sp.]